MLSGATGREGTAGYVLAGGQSSRMGLNKALLRWRGTTLLDYVAGEVEAATGSVAIVGGEGLTGFRYVADEMVGAGPLGGICAALTDSRAERNLIVACDMPGVTRGWLERLVLEAEQDVTVPVTADGRMHPLCAVWRRGAASSVREALQRGVHSVQEVVRALHYRLIAVENEAIVANVNTPQEWAHFTRRGLE